MEKSFRGTVGRIRETLAENEVSHADLAKILSNICEWRKNRKDGIRIGEGDVNVIGWNNFLHGRIPKGMRRILPRVGESDMKKGRRIIRAIVETVLAGAEVAWRVRCDLAAGASSAGLAVGKFCIEGGYLAAS